MHDIAISGLTAAAISCAICGFLFVFKNKIDRGRDLIEEKYYSIAIEVLGSDITFKKFFEFFLVFGLLLSVAAFLMIGNFLVSISVFFVVLSAPVPYFKVLLSARRKKIEEVMPEALQQLSSALHGGLSLRQAIAQVAETAPAPMNREFQIIFEQTEGSKSLERVINMSKARINSQNFDMVAIVISTALEKGGDVAEAIDKLASVIQELQRLEAKVISSIAKGKRNMQIMTAMPVLLVILAIVLEPSYVDQVTQSYIGVGLLFFAAMIYFIAVLLAVRMSKVSI